MTALADDFRRAIDYVFRNVPSRHPVGIGPFTAALAFRDSADASQFLSAFPAPSTAREPDLTVAILCEEDPVLGRLVPQDRKGIYSFSEDGCYALWHPDPGEALHVYDLRSRRGFSFLPGSQAIESFRSRPVLPLIHAHFSDSEWAPVHAGAIGRNGKVLLLAGPGGSGKSTAVVACAADGWDCAGDDYVLVAPKRGVVEPIYASARLRPSAVSAIGDFVAKGEVAVSHDFDDPRHELRLGRGFAGVNIAGGRIAAILLPRRTGAAAPVFRPAGRAETFYAVVASTAEQWPGMRGSLTPKLMALARCAPSFVVDTGSDPKAIAAAFDVFLRALNDQAT